MPDDDSRRAGRGEAIFFPPQCQHGEDRALQGEHHELIADRDAQQPRRPKLPERAVEHPGSDQDGADERAKFRALDPVLRAVGLQQHRQAGGRKQRVKEAAAKEDRHVGRVLLE